MLNKNMDCATIATINYIIFEFDLYKIMQKILNKYEYKLLYNNTILQYL